MKSRGADGLAEVWFGEVRGEEGICSNCLEKEVGVEMRAKDWSTEERIKLSAE